MNAYFCFPTKNVRGGLILIHEVFGTTEQLKRLARHFAELGIVTVIPALFDRIEKGVSLSYDKLAEGRQLANQCQLDLLVLDLAAAMKVLKLSKIAAVGYCWGGGVAYVAASQLELCCAISYYGTRMVNYLDRQPRCPFQFHFGGLDQAIPESDIEKIRQVNPEQEIFVYPNADHAFANADRPSFDRDSAKLAEERLLRFLMDNFVGA